MSEKELSEKHLTETEKLFCDIYIENGRKATEAYKAMRPEASTKTAGTIGSRWKQKVEKSGYFVEKSREFVENCGLSKKGQVQLLSEIVARSLKGKPKLTFNTELMEWIEKKDDDGNVVYEYDPKNVIGAIAEQNKILGFHKPTVTKLEGTGENGKIEIVRRII
jgi:phage terminase small subunit